MPDFHLIALELEEEEEQLEQALRALRAVEPGELAFLPAWLAWTPLGSGRALARLVSFAQERDINLVTTLNLGPELTEDLPGREPGARYNAVVIFTRHGDVHVPQAALYPHGFEMDRDLAGPDIGVSGYRRVNRVRLDVDEGLIEARFLVGADLAVFRRLSPAELRCDLLVLLGRLERGAEAVATRWLRRALEAGVAGTVLQVNPFELPMLGAAPLAIKVEAALDVPELIEPAPSWPKPRALRAAFHVYEDAQAADLASVAELPRRGRIAIARSHWDAEVSLGDYPVTIVL